MDEATSSQNEGIPFDSAASPWYSPVLSAEGSQNHSNEISCRRGSLPPLLLPQTLHKQAESAISIGSILNTQTPEDSHSSEAALHFKQGKGVVTNPPPALHSNSVPLGPMAPMEGKQKKNTVSRLLATYEA